MKQFNYNNTVNNIIDLLNNINVDGETMEYIIDKVGLSDQMLRQLIMKNQNEEINNLLEEKNNI